MELNNRHRKIIIWTRFLRLFRNVYLDLRYQRTFLGGGINSSCTHLGAFNIQNSDYNVLPNLFYHAALLGRWRGGIHAPEKIVDVGCGRGRVINWLLSQHCTCPIVGVELEESVAKATARRLSRYKNIQIICGCLGS